MGFALAGAIIGIIGTAISTYATYTQSQEQQRAAKAEAGLRTQEAESARQSAAFQERQFRTRISLLLGNQIALGAASGIDISSGSPLLLQLNNVRQGELEALNIQRTGEVRASTSDFEARLARMRASFFGQQGAGAIASGTVQGAGTILGGLTRFYNQSGGANLSSGQATTVRLGRQPFIFGRSVGE